MKDLFAIVADVPLGVPGIGAEVSEPEGICLREAGFSVSGFDFKQHHGLNFTRAKAVDIVFVPMNQVVAISGNDLS